MRSGGKRELRAAAQTDVGLQRSHNEDTYLCREDLGIFAVIDGVGGEVAGETAARKAAEILLARLSRQTAAAPQRLREAITLANNAIFEEAQSDPRLHGMACVLTAAVLEDERLTVGHVGDSRLYRLGRGEIVKVTRDHSPVGLMEERGELSEQQAMDHPRRSEIFRDVGSTPFDVASHGFVDIYELTLGSQEAILLCSDGLSDQVSAERIRAIVELHAGRPERAVKSLIQAANEAGGRDNVTVVLVEGERYAKHLDHSDGGHVEGVPPDAARYAGRQSPPKERRTEARSTWRTTRLAERILVGMLTAAVLVLGVTEWRERRTEPRTWRVGGDSETHPSISAALAAARPGDVVEVAPGTYDERIALRDGVALVSDPPRAAVLRLRDAGSLDEPVAVLADGVRDARLVGFRIVGDDDHPLMVGLRLVGASIVIEDVEVTGAERAAIEVLGPDRSLIQLSSLHANGGAGVVLQGPAFTRLRHNLIEDNGGGVDPPAAGVEASGDARPSFHDNRFSGNAAGPIRGLHPDLRYEIERRNQLPPDAGAEEETE